MSTRVRYLIDEHISRAIATGLQKRGVDAVTVSEVDLLGADDEILLAFTRRHKRVIVTKDRDFLRLAAREQDHRGIVYIPHGRSIGEIVRLLDLLAEVSNMEEMNGRVEYF